LLVPAVAPELSYVPVPKAFDLPRGMTMGPPASVAFDSKGHMFVLTRGDRTFFEFDKNGAFVRAFGDKLFTRSHGAAHRSRRQSVGDRRRRARRREAEPAWRRAAHTRHQGRSRRVERGDGSHKFNQPNDIAIGAKGDVFVAQGHTPGPDGDARVLKFDKNGRFLKSWGGKGSGPGQFSGCAQHRYRSRRPAVGRGSGESTDRNLHG